MHIYIFCIHTLSAQTNKNDETEEKKTHRHTETLNRIQCFWYTYNIISHTILHIDPFNIISTLWEWTTRQKLSAAKWGKLNRKNVFITRLRMRTCCGCNTCSMTVRANTKSGLHSFLFWRNEQYWCGTVLNRMNGTRNNEAVHTLTQSLLLKRNREHSLHASISIIKNKYSHAACIPKTNKH